MVKGHQKEIMNVLIHSGACPLSLTESTNFVGNSCYGTNVFLLIMLGNIQDDIQDDIHDDIFLRCPHLRPLLLNHNGRQCRAGPARVPTGTYVVFNSTSVPFPLISTLLLQIKPFGLHIFESFNFNTPA